MSTMLATIDDITAAKVDRDRKDHGAGYLRVLADGRVEHVPWTPQLIRFDDERADRRSRNA